MEWKAPSPLDYFAALVAQDDGFPLTEAAASLAQDEDPDLDLQSVLSRMDRMTSNLRGRLPTDASPMHSVRVLHRFFFQELGFAGNVNDYYNPANSYLHEVLRTRRGIPITLAVLYIELAQQIGLSAVGLSFPGHFLVKVALPQGDAVIDPLSGQSLSREALDERLEPFVQRRRRGGLPSERLLTNFLVPAAPREIIARMLRNLEAIHRESEDWPRLLAVLHRLVILQPLEWDWRRERGLTLAELGRATEAIDDLSTYLDHAVAAADHDRVAARLQALREAGPTRWH